MTTITDIITFYPRLELELSQLKNRYYSLNERVEELNEENKKLKNELAETSQQSPMLTPMLTDNNDLSLNSDANGELQYDYSDMNFSFNNNNNNNNIETSLVPLSNSNTLTGFQNIQQPQWPSIEYNNYMDLENRNRSLEMENNKLKEEILDSERIYEDVIEKNNKLQTTLNNTKRKNDNLKTDVENLSKKYEEDQEKIVELQNMIESLHNENTTVQQERTNQLLALENVKNGIDINFTELQQNYQNLSQDLENSKINLQKIVEFLTNQLSINNYVDANDFINKIDSIFRGNRNLLAKNNETIENQRIRILTLESNTVEKSIYEQLINVLRNKLGLRSFISVDDFMEQLNNVIEQNSILIENKDKTILDLRNKIYNLEMSSGEKEQKIQNIINKIANGIQTQISEIDNEIKSYNNIDQGFKDKPLKLEEIVNTENYTITEEFNPAFIPFLRELSKYFYMDTNRTDFEDINNINIFLYHAYLVTIKKLFEMFPKNYISGYIDYVFLECKLASETPNRILQLPKLIIPQTFQTNSLYYLMNRYNSKIYQPDRVLDFGNFVFNFLKPEFRPDETKALNLFQPDVGKRYNSILIYSDATIDILQKLKNKLQNTKK